MTPASFNSQATTDEADSMLEWCREELLHHWEIGHSCLVSLTDESNVHIPLIDRINSETPFDNPIGNPIPHIEIYGQPVIPYAFISKTVLGSTVVNDSLAYHYSSMCAYIDFENLEDATKFKLRWL